ncbi:S1C family serine protease [Blautia sp. MSJ-19]|uniref:S1C family serine protease n=1 Tax=Blautia sp. MSJ-19 TaxID=2841517 RepID=UPI001C0EEBAD|nr:trypsin-like peptidase domain-containing protein [Blautia sp. MSJ-19]MBU5481077.1 trypsin-like peptidase domain-containing protein [Blautia sp. MSJ-19]
MSDNGKWNLENAPQNDTENGRQNDPPRYEHYRMHQGAEQKMTDMQPPRKKPEHHRHGGRKLAATVSLAVVFGLVAGVVFQGVNRVSDKYFGTDSSSSAQVETAQLAVDASSDNTEASEAETDTSDTAATDTGSTPAGTVADVARAAMPTVVAITSVSIQEIPNYFRAFGFGYGTQQYSSEGSGSGIIVGENDDELLIATNNHVVSGATTLSVCFVGNDVVNAEEETVDMSGSDGDVNVEDAVSAKIKGTDETNDLAVVAVQKSDIPEDTLAQIKIAQLGNSDALEVGEQVVAIGNALGYGQSVTSGWISALNRSISTDEGTSSGLIQTDAAINPGNSGGALLNMQGEVIGINSAKYADSAVEGMGYAIPISKAQPILEELMNRQTRDKVDEADAAYLGVVSADLSTEAIQMYDMPEGAFVIRVDKDSAAGKSGIQKGDIIVSFDGQAVSGKDDLENKLTYYASGESVDVGISRADNGEYVQKTIQVTLGGRTGSGN